MERVPAVHTALALGRILVAMRNLKQAVVDEIFCEHGSHLLLELREAPQQVVEDVHQATERKISIGATDLLSWPLNNITRQLFNQAEHLILQDFEVSRLEYRQDNANMIDDF